MSDKVPVLRDGIADLRTSPLWWALAICLLVRLVSLGFYALADTTEARYADVAQTMALSGDWITPWHHDGLPFWAKPPLSIWATATSFKWLGVSDFTARLPHFVVALLILALVWDWCRRLQGGRPAVMSICLLAGALLFNVAAGAVMTDMVMVLGTTLVMRGAWDSLHRSADSDRAARWSVFVGLAMGLMAKGPVAVVLALAPVGIWGLVEGQTMRVLKRLLWMPGLLLVVVTVFPWYALAEWRTPGFLDYFLVGEHWSRFVESGWKGDRYGSAHAYPRGSIWLFAMAACLPWILLLPGFFLHRRVRENCLPVRSLRTYLLLWAVAPCMFFSLSGNVLWTYVLPGLPALAVVTGVWMSADSRVNAVNRVVISGLLISTLALVTLLGYRETHQQAKTTKPLVLTYLARAQPAENLLVLESRHYSASFYSRGKAQLVKDEAALRTAMTKHPLWVLLTLQQSASLSPDTMRRLEEQDRYGAITLYRSRAL